MGVGQWEKRVNVSRRGEVSFKGERTKGSFVKGGTRWPGDKTDLSVPRCCLWVSHIGSGWEARFQVSAQIRGSGLVLGCQRELQRHENHSLLSEWSLKRQPVKTEEGLTFEQEAGETAEVFSPGSRGAVPACSPPSFWLERILIFFLHPVLPEVRAQARSLLKNKTTSKLEFLDAP